MIVIPAIDILDGVGVRLYQGKYEQKDVVASSVEEMALYFANMQPPYLHMVDLNGAKSGTRENAKIIVECAKKIDIPIEVGGGIRTMEDIAFYLEQGIARVILGTSALKDRMFLEQALNRYADRIVVGIDCKDGYVQAQGWLESSDVYYLDFAKEMEKLNVKTIIVTDISKDGTLAGPNYEMLKRLQETVKIDIIASGGIKNIEHIKRLNSMRLYGAITGKAIYAKTLDLNEAWKICKEG